ncbi:MAG: hypothetical protein WBF17_25825, partial [Phycisphaerae bacterium]
GMTGRGIQTVSWGHERDIDDAFGSVNLALQALGTNAGGGWFPQGDWVPLVKLARKYEVAYVELYPPDFKPLDTKHRIVEAFTHAAAATAKAAGALPDGFLGYRPWLKKRNRVLHVREGTIRKTFRAGSQPRRVGEVAMRVSAPAGTRVEALVRTCQAGGRSSEWKGRADAAELPAGTEAEVLIRMHTDDGLLTPRVSGIRLEWR